MKVLYRPQRGRLAEAMAEVKEFSSVDEMFKYLVKEHSIEGREAFEIDEIYISDYGYDHRIDWKTYLIAVTRYFNENYSEKYHYPQAIGYCTFKD